MHVALVRFSCSLLACWLFTPAVMPARAQQPGPTPREVARAGAPAEDDGERIITPEEVRNIVRSRALVSFRIVLLPARVVARGMEKGLVAFETRRVRERLRLLRENLAARGVDAMFGGMGEGTGFGGGGSYTAKFSDSQSLRFLGRATFKRYQEFDVLWSFRKPSHIVELEGSYQWRPQENFYGLGHDSLRNQRSNFALRQSWTGLRWETRIRKPVAWGAGYKLAWFSTGPGTNPALSPPDVFTANLPGYDTNTRLQSVQTHLDLDFIREEYALGGGAHLGASYQDGLGRSRLRYFAYELRLEGRLPVASGRSALVGEANVELTRERGGSDPIPFYLLPRIGGNTTLRGFPLDRFYGRNLALLTLEYRFRLHPNIQSFLFFDEGQIFDRTSDLTWGNWHRTYGIGFRLRSARGTFLRVAYGYSGEGHAIHIVFGDRPRPPLRGPIRYGAYTR